ncbi:ParA family protein [Botrimarina mediterranea]|uniref:Soj-like protein n=1 Tax=Botrimarina mediterranea TaxID=2528022 RepID=A0A518K440_9BACT|nr:ParA family protein [Botrimarina mediterranea]QDV72564.1 Soj-like protein [Botrimarina mediterranea]QDV77136.1 Soj-like protein [Planctomycetes bacterium K2D]
MGRVLCIANQKGGVGKTTTAVNLAAALAASGRKTLLIDLDPQCNATSAIGGEPTARHPLVQRTPIREAVKATDIEGLQLLPGSRSFHDVDHLATAGGGESRLVADHLAASLSVYDAVLVDCPPSLGTLTETALATADEVVMPLECEYFAMEGLTQMIELVKRVMTRRNSRLRLGGILLTKHDPTLELTHEVEREVRDFFGEAVFQTVVPRDVALAEAPSHGQSIFQYDCRSRGARAYIEICQEVLSP